MLPMLAGCPVWQDQSTPISQMRMTEPMTGRSYWLYVPSYYDARQAWPLVVTLHGTVPWDDSDRQIKEWKALAEAEGFIVVAPALHSPQGILSVPLDQRMEQLARDEEIILATMRDVSGRYTIDPDSIVLSGFSAGGFPMYYVGLKHPDRFAALVARACNSDVRVFEQIELTDQALEMPVYILLGRSDLAPIREQSWAAYRWLMRRGVRNTEMVRMSGGHIRIPNVAWTRARQHLGEN